MTIEALTKGAISRKFTGQYPGPDMLNELATWFAACSLAWAAGIMICAYINTPLMPTMAVAWMTILLSAAAYYAGSTKLRTGCSALLCHLALAVSVGLLLHDALPWAACSLPIALAVLTYGWFYERSPEHGLEAHGVAMTTYVVSLGTYALISGLPWHSAPMAVSAAGGLYIYAMYHLSCGQYMSDQTLTDYALLPITLPIATVAVSMLKCWQWITSRTFRRPLVPPTTTAS